MYGDALTPAHSTWRDPRGAIRMARSAWRDPIDVHGISSYGTRITRTAW